MCKHISFKSEESILKVSGLSSTGNGRNANEPFLEVSYQIAYRINMKRTPDTVREFLVSEAHRAKS